MNLRGRCHLYIKLCFSSFALITLGSIFLLSSSYIYGISAVGNPVYFFQRHLLWLLLGAAAFLVVNRIDTSRIERYSLPFFIFTIGVLLLPVVFGGLRWIRLGPFSFQPAELVKISFLVYLADYLKRRRSEIVRPRVFIVPIGFLALVTAILQFQKDVGTFVVIAITFGVLLFIAGARRKHVAIFGASLVLLFCGLVLLFPYRLQRIRTYMDPSADPHGAGYQTIQAIIAMGSGGLFGRGLGAGERKLKFLPEAHKDYVYAVVGEELGLFGTSLVLMFFAIIVFCGFDFAKLAKDDYDKFLAAGISALMGVQFLLHAGVVVNLVPAKGTTLPFFSVGGSSLLINIIALGLLHNIGRKVCFEDPVDSAEPL